MKLRWVIRNNNKILQVAVANKGKSTVWEDIPIKEEVDQYNSTVKDIPQKLEVDKQIDDFLEKFVRSASLEEQFKFFSGMSEVVKMLDGDIYENMKNLVGGNYEL